ncbi:MAG: SHOCT domain-containing protein [Chloroflexi bacterium]|nr:SHOCT domain-containing protein [Chloroflexota bacterium]
MHWFGWGWGMGGMWLFGLLVVVLVVLLVRTIGQPAQPPSSREPAEEIVRARYARGEISREEYERVLADLRRDRAA